MCVAEAMNSYLHTGCLASPFQFMVETGFCDREESFIRGEAYNGNSYTPAAPDIGNWNGNLTLVGLNEPEGDAEK